MPKIDFSKPVRRKGDKKPLRVLCTDGPGCHPVVCVDEDGGPSTYTLDGQFFFAGSENADMDLENVPKKHKVTLYMNVSHYGYTATGYFPYDDKETAERNAVRDVFTSAIAVPFEFEYEEGFGVKKEEDKKSVC